MQQEPQKDAPVDAAVPAAPAAPEGGGSANEPEQVIRPEDEALVAQRLRELGYIE